MVFVKKFLQKLPMEFAVEPKTTRNKFRGKCRMSVNLLEIDDLHVKAGERRF